MIILVDRYLSTNEATLSRVYVDMSFACMGLEDEARTVKVPGETRIPAGRYKVRLRTFGPHHERYLKDRRFRAFHIGMLEICGVPGFSDILIHVGNTEHDTAGCLLVGLSRDELTMTLSQSAAGYAPFYQKVAPAAQADHLSITFEDNDLAQAA